MLPSASTRPSAMTTIGWHASHEQIPPSALLTAVHVYDAQWSCNHDAFDVAASACLRRAHTASAGSDAPYTADPATKTSAPASAHRSMVEADTPPSTWSHSSSPCLLISSRVRRMSAR